MMSFRIRQQGVATTTAKKFIHSILIDGHLISSPTTIISHSFHQFRQSTNFSPDTCLYFSDDIRPDRGLADRHRDSASDIFGTLSLSYEISVIQLELLASFRGIAEFCLRVWRTISFQMACLHRFPSGCRNITLVSQRCARRISTQPFTTLDPKIFSEACS